MDSLFFIASKLVWGLIRPDSWLVIGAGLALIGIVSGRRRLALGAGGFTFGALFLLAVLPLGDLLIGPLESRYPLPPEPERVDGIILLGGAEDGTWTVAGPQPRFNDAAERFTEALRLARRHPGAKLVFTGGSGALRDLGRGGMAPGASVAERFFLEQGLPPGQLILETASRNTAENARLSRDLVRPAPGETWLLVTSAFHMERAMRSFEAAGWTGLLAWPTDFRARPFRAGLGWDLRHNLDLLTTALREHVGLLAYRIAGRG